MKKPQTMLDEAQPRNITRADVLMTEGFGLEVDGRMKRSFPTLASAEKSALELKTKYPMLQVKVYDALSSGITCTKPAGSRPAWFCFGLLLFSTMGVHPSYRKGQPIRD